MNDLKLRRKKKKNLRYKHLGSTACQQNGSLRQILNYKAIHYEYNTVYMLKRNTSHCQGRSMKQMVLSVLSSFQKWCYNTDRTGEQILAFQLVTSS